MSSWSAPSARQPAASRSALVRRVRRRKRRTVVALVLVVFLGLALVSSVTSSTPARAATGRAITVTPAVELGNQVVEVQWTGFHPTKGETWTVTIQQCIAVPTTLADCETALPFPNSAGGNEVVDGITNLDGTGAAFLEVRPTAQLPSLDCSQTHPCSLVAYENDGKPIPPGGMPLTATTAPIAFAKSAADCPQVENFDIRAEGEASAAQAFYSWAAGLCTANPAQILDYTLTSSVLGREDFLGKLVDVGVTSTAATASELAAAPGHPAFTYAPVDLSAIVVAYNMKDPVTGQRITDLKLSPRLLARLITDTRLLDFFNDPELNRLNPGHHWPSLGVSTPLIRADKNADTYIATSWMAADSATRAFLAGTDPDGVPVTSAFKNYPYPTDIFLDVDANTAYVPLSSVNQIGQRVFYGVTPTGGSRTPTDQTGFMGLMDLPTAVRYALPVAQLVNGGGQAVAPDTAGILAGYHAMTTDANGITKFPNFASTDTAAYPLVKVDYAMVPTTTTATLADNLKRFLTFVAGPGQQQLPAGLVPLTTDLVAQTTAAADAIKVDTPTPTPTTTTPPTTVPASTTTTTTLGTVAAGGGTGGSFDGTSFGSSDSFGSDPVTTPPSVSGPTRRAGGQRPAATPNRPAAKPVVNLAVAGEHVVLPLVVLLALLCGFVAALMRAGSPLRRGLSVLRARLRRRKPPVPAAI